ncbi:MAG TPA: hypothetical protein VGJ71_01915 [Candidatus Limnocylindrales bacterium]
MRAAGWPAAIALAAAISVTACGEAAAPDLSHVGNHVDVSYEGGNAVFTASPWPLDKTIAYLCANQPGKEFTVANPIPATTARCVGLNVKTADDRLVATFDRSRLSAEMAGQFRSTAAVYLAVAGSRGPASLATVLTVIFDPPSSTGG